MSTYNFSLLYTTARLNLIPSVINRWLESIHNSNFEIIIVTDNDYFTEEQYSNVKFKTNNSFKNCVTGWNLCAKHSSNEILIQISDDLYPPANWDYYISETIRLNGGIHENIALNFLDERKCKNAVYHPIITRECYLNTGYIYPEDFESMFCDNWFYLYHSKYSKLIENNNIFWNHEHRTTSTKAVIDEVTLVHESYERYIKGQEILKKYIYLQNL